MRIGIGITRIKRDDYHIYHVVELDAQVLISHTLYFPKRYAPTLCLAKNELLPDLQQKLFLRSSGSGLALFPVRFDRDARVSMRSALLSFSGILFLERIIQEGTTLRPYEIGYSVFDWLTMMMASSSSSSFSVPIDGRALGGPTRSSVSFKLCGSGRDRNFDPAFRRHSGDRLWIRIVDHHVDTRGVPCFQPFRLIVGQGDR